ncbi:hypothetical protein [Dactylosporangium sp. CS-033363]|uniref:hypothetical protein n=1 Tax=Dactylosporangium sp. CS-033363 TaxID=3239935 RepID=UPI003D8AE1A9
MKLVRPLTTGIVAVAAFLALLPATAEAAPAGNAKGQVLHSTACKFRSPSCRWN